MEPNNPNMNTTGDSNSFGPVVGLIIILVVIVLGGLYFWGQRTGGPATYGTNGESVSDIEEQSSSDSIDSIETDLEATDTTNLDAELNAS